MTKWAIAYKDSNGKWKVFAYVSSRAKVSDKLNALFETYPGVSVIQIQKVVR